MDRYYILNLQQACYYAKYCLFVCLLVFLFFFLLQTTCSVHVHLSIVVKLYLRGGGEEGRRGGGEEGRRGGGGVVPGKHEFEIGVVQTNTITCSLQ